MLHFLRSKMWRGVGLARQSPILFSPSRRSPQRTCLIHLRRRSPRRMCVLALRRRSLRRPCLLLLRQRGYWSPVLVAPLPQEPLEPVFVETLPGALRRALEEEPLESVSLSPRKLLLSAFAVLGSFPLMCLYHSSWSSSNASSPFRAMHSTCFTVRIVHLRYWRS